MVDKSKAERLSANERREAILEAAITEFAAYGLYGASTVNIANRVGISQPYVFRLFGTKKKLFMAALILVYERIKTTFHQAAEKHPDNPLSAMGQAYVALLHQRDELLLVLQGFAATSDAEVEEVVQRCYKDMYYFVQNTSGANEEELRNFIAKGMLMTTAAAANLPQLVPQESWACQLLDIGH